MWGSHRSAGHTRSTKESRSSTAMGPLLGTWHDRTGGVRSYSPTHNGPGWDSNQQARTRMRMRMELGFGMGLGPAHLRCSPGSGCWNRGRLAGQSRAGKRPFCPELCEESKSKCKILRCFNLSFIWILWPWLLEQNCELKHLSLVASSTQL